MGLNGRPHRRPQPTAPSVDQQAAELIAKAAEQQAGGIQIGYVPANFQIVQGQGPDGKPWPVLIVQTPAGMHGFFVHPDQAKGMGQALIDSGQASTAGIVLPT